MASAQQISAYFASFGFKIDTKSVTDVKKKVADIKSALEKKLTLKVTVGNVVVSSAARTKIRDIKTSIAKLLNVQMTATGVKINRAAVRKAIRDQASLFNINLRIDRFAINGAALRRAVQDAYDRGVTLTLNPRANRTGGGGGGNNLLNSSRTSRFNNIPSVMDRLGTGVATMATGMGMWEINRISEDLQTSKVALGTITEGRGEEAYNWLKERGRERGFDYSSQLPVFSSYMAASINKQGYEGSLDSFAKLTDYGLTHGADKEGMKRAMTAIGQMWSKGQIHQEELKSQLSEAKGFAGAREHFALAWQDKTGGGLVGQEAEAALLKAMEKGLVKSAEVLPLVVERMAIKAAGGIDAYKKTTTYAHGRFDTGFKESIEIFGKGGFDEGMRNFFLTMATHMENSTQLLSDLGKMFKYVMQVFLTFIQTGITFVKLLNDIHPALSGTLALLYPLYKIFGKWGAVIGAVMIALEDIQVYLDGGNSALGAFADTLEDFFGIDPTPLIVSMGLIGIAVAAAFSPITATIMGIAALIEMYRRYKAMKEKDASSPAYDPTLAGGRAPSTADIEAFKQTARAKIANAPNSSLKDEWNYTVAKGLDSIGLLNPIAKWQGYGAIENANYHRLNAAVNSGAITEEDRGNYLIALSSGMMSNSDIATSLSKINAGKSSLDSRLMMESLQNQPISITIDGTVANQTFEFNLNSANGVFGNQAVPAQQ